MDDAAHVMAGDSGLPVEEVRAWLEREALAELERDDDRDHAWPEATRECPQCGGAGCFPVGPIDRLSGYPDDVVECSLCETTGEVPESVAHEYGGDL